MAQLFLKGGAGQPAATGRQDLLLYAVAGLYLCIFGALLIWTAGLPYVLDNNETFSSIVHAKNILLFGLQETYGLTDEVFSPHLAAHPYVYTHQGNFPRIYALLLYVLGAQSVEAQIITTTLTIGLASIVLAYLVVSRLADRKIAALVCVLMMTDYIFVAQWQVVTWRVWHIFFFWFGLWCVDHTARGERPALWLALVGVTHACLFYFEIAFAAFSSVVTALYAAWSLRPRLRLVSVFFSAQAIGLGIGVLILACQLIAYLGWDAAMDDFRLTWQARNMGGNEEFQQQVRDFMESNHIAFWYNFSQSVMLRDLGFIWSQFVSRTLSVYSPMLVIASFSGFVGVLVSRIVVIGSWPDWFPARPIASGPGIVIIVTAFLTPTVVISTNLVPGADIALIALIVVLAVSAFLACLTISDLQLVYGAGPIPFPVIAAPVVSAAVLLVIVVTANDALAWPGEIWVKSVSAVGPTLGALMVVFALWTGIQLSVWAALPRYAAFTGPLARLAVIPLIGFIAFVVVWTLVPGYVLSGYLNRFVPMVAFSNLVLLGIGVAAMLGVAWVELRDFTTRPWVRAIWRSFGRSDVWRVRPLLPTAAFDIGRVAFCITLAILAPAQWIGVNTAYLERLPPNQMRVLKFLNDSQFHGAGFVVDNYAAPVAVQTGGWAYFDPVMSYRRLVSIDGQVEIQRDLSYLWFADRMENAAYLRPDFYVCFSMPNLPIQMQMPGGYKGECSERPMTKTGNDSIDGILRTHLEGLDETGRDQWSVVRLIWPDETGMGQDDGLVEEIDVGPD